MLYRFFDLVYGWVLKYCCLVAESPSKMILETAAVDQGSCTHLVTETASDQNGLLRMIYLALHYKDLSQKLSIYRYSVLSPVSYTHLTLPTILRV